MSFLRSVWLFGLIRLYAIHIAWMRRRHVARQNLAELYVTILIEDKLWLDALQVEEEHCQGYRVRQGLSNIQKMFNHDNQ